jgi:hypothetical protein
MNLSTVKCLRGISPIYLRHSRLLFSTSSNEQLTNWGKVKKWIEPFSNGFRDLYKENKLAYQCWKKVQNGESLSRSELFNLRQAPRDLRKSLPLVLFFCVPTIGYLSPFIGYKFPKQTLSWQFWDDDQTTRFFSQDIKAKAAHYEGLKAFLRERVQADFPINVDSIPEFQQAFKEGGSAAITSLDAPHLQLLCSTHEVLPKMVIPYLPNSVLHRYLRSRCSEIGVDDLLLMREGMESLTKCELMFACLERGIVCDYDSEEELRACLRNWLDMYPARRLGHLPCSFALHACAMIEFNNPKSIKGEK